MARVVVPGMPHHVTQRGNRRQPVFFCDDDYALYLRLLGEHCGCLGVAIWAYCLMPNHVHLVVVPRTAEALALAIGEVHRRYTCHVNARECWTGYLWQGRFGSSVMDTPHTLAAVRYVELNPVRAGLTPEPQEYPWSSARAHLDGRDDRLVQVEPMLSAVGDWSEYLAQSEQEAEISQLRRHAKTGRPLGSPEFTASLEPLVGRILRKRKPGPKPPGRPNQG
jgi:putative transposase